MTLSTRDEFANRSDYIAARARHIAREVLALSPLPATVEELDLASQQRLWQLAQRAGVTPERYLADARDARL